jgi:hypothetical protein
LMGRVRMGAALIIHPLPPPNKGRGYYPARL